MIRLTIPSIANEDIQNVKDVLISGYLVQGAQVKKFEEAVADYVNRRFAVAVSSGTAALHLALLSLEVGPGDIVIVSAYSYIATANVVELCGARPVFVDIKEDTFNMDSQCLQKTLANLMSDKDASNRIKAIIPVHTFGQVADMPEIMKIADHYNIPVIEDAACSLGADWQGTQAGGWGRMGCFSFHPRKAITTAEGGMIVFDDQKLYRKLRALRNHGQDPEASNPDFILPGFNYRMSEIHAALGLSQMVKIDRIIAARRSSAQVYKKLLNGTSIKQPYIPIDSHPVYQSYVVLLPEEMAARRQAIIEKLKAMGIETTIGTWHMPLATYYKAKYGYTPGDFPITDRVFSRSLTLPLYECITLLDQQSVINSLIKV